MALTKFGFIVTGSELTPDNHRVSLTSPTFEMIVVGISVPSQGLQVARLMVEEGVQLIELCGGFGPIWTAKVIEEIDGSVPVGSVGYGPESITQMHDLFL